MSGLSAEDRYVNGVDQWGKFRWARACVEVLIGLGGRQHLSGVDEWQQQGGKWQRQWIWGMTDNGAAEKGVQNILMSSR